MQRLLGKVCLVSGAAGGIGSAIVDAFAAEGAQVAVADVDRTGKVDRIVEALQRVGCPAQGFWVDVADETAVVTLVSRVEAAFEGIDVLVNCAGITQPKAFTEISSADWDRMMAVNLRGTFLLTRQVAPLMLRARSGRIINVASQLGQRGAPMLVHYSASKAGVIGLTKALARELAPHVTVNAIAPGPVLTDMIRGRDAAWFEEIAAELPIGRIGAPEEVAPTAVFLASDDGALYTGQTLGPNGGHVML